MKKYISLLTLTSYFLLANPVLAATEDLCPRDSSGYKNLCNLGIGNVVGTFISFVFMLSIIATLLYLVWGGFKWLTSGGDKAAVQSAREHIVAALIGIIIVFLSYFFLNILFGFFFGPSASLSFITIPTLR